MTSRTIIRKAFEKCLEAVEPRQIVRNNIKISSSSIQICDSEVFPRTPETRLVLISFGKASILMANGAKDILKAPLLQKTLVLAPELQKSSESFENVVFAAKNNFPDEKSIEATENIISEIKKLDNKDTIFIFLISGGGSALLCSPRPPVTLAEKLKIIKLLQSKGATIEQLNTVRQRISTVKGGKLLENIKNGRAVTLMISDVIGDKMDIIASGPTVKPGKMRSVKEVLETLRVRKDELEPHIWSILERDEEPLTPTSPSKNFIISSNISALRAASEFLTSSGFNAFIVTSELCGNATKIGRQFANLLSSENLQDSELLTSSKLQIDSYPIALLFGGETTVNLAENPGKGGRNQEMVLACLDALKNKKPTHQFTFLSAGTDGQDGPTDAAGAIISNADLLEPCPTSSDSLTHSDSYNFWKTFKNGSCHLKTGPSGTNVMDIQILLLESHQ